MSYFLLIKEAPRTLIDWLSLWIVCTVWPGIIPGGIIFIESHRILFAMGVSVVMGLIATIYIWKNNQIATETGSGTEST